MLIELLVYIAAGLITGFFAGLLGIGGGLILVPLLSTVFVYFLTGDHLVHLAIGTSMATILITSLASVKAHQKHDAVRWDIVKTITPGLLLGGLFGGWVAQFLAADLLAKIFASIELVIAIKLLLNIQPHPQRELPGFFGRSVAGSVIGSLSSLVGIGGGALNTPYMLWHNVKIQQAIATSAACSLPIALAGTIGFLIGGWHTENLPNYATGYIYWPAFFGIVVASYFTAPMGANLAHRLPVKTLKKVFAILLILLAIKMFWF